MKAMAKVAVLLAAILLITGCTTTKKLYKGPNLPENQLAVLYRADDLHLKRVDNRKVKGYGKYLLLPGEHTFYYEYSDIVDHGKRRASAKLPPTMVLLKPGRKYRPQYMSPRWPSVILWIEESEDGKEWRKIPNLRLPKPRR
jgi:hypothetical protein